jgi:hypothetical protein
MIPGTLGQAPFFAGLLDFATWIMEVGNAG